MCSNNNLCFAYSISPAKFKSNRIESYRISLTFRCVQNGTASGPRYIKRIQIQSSCPFPFPCAFAVPHFESMLSIIYGHIQTYFPNLLPCREGELGRSSVGLGVRLGVGVAAARAAILIVVTKGDSRLQVVLDSLGLSRVASMCVVRNAKAKL